MVASLICSVFSVSTTIINNSNEEGEQPIDLSQTTELTIRKLEEKGLKDIVTKTEQFITPNAAEGLKIYGTAKFPTVSSENLVSGNYIILQFLSDGNHILQQIIITWPEDDIYAEQTVERILASIELKKTEE